MVDLAKSRFLDLKTRLAALLDEDSRQTSQKNSRWARANEARRAKSHKPVPKADRDLQVDPGNRLSFDGSSPNAASAHDSLDQPHKYQENQSTNATPIAITHPGPSIAPSSGSPEQPAAQPASHPVPTHQSAPLLRASGFDDRLFAGSRGKSSETCATMLAVRPQIAQSRRSPN
jgi:hypothetical protein